MHITNFCSCQSCEEVDEVYIDRKGNMGDWWQKNPSACQQKFSPVSFHLFNYKVTVETGMFINLTYENFSLRTERQTSYFTVSLNIKPIAKLSQARYIPWYSEPKVSIASHKTWLCAIN